MTRVVLALVAVLASACAPTRQETLTPVIETVRERLHPTVTADAAIATLEAAPLTVDAAGDLALLQNPALQAAYARLGVSAGQLVSAGLFANPRVSGNVRFGEQKPDFEVDVTENITSLLFAFPHAWASGKELEAAQLDAAALAVETAAQARAGLVHLVTAARVAKLREDVAKNADAALDLATRMNTAGNLSRRDLLLVDARARESHIAADDARVNMLRARADESALVGEGRWEPAHELPPLDVVALGKTNLAPGFTVGEGPVHELHAAALDVRREALRRALGYRGVEALAPNVELGVGVEQREGHLEVGPSASISLPVVDIGQGERHAIESERDALDTESQAALDRYVVTLERLNAEAPMAAARVDDARALVATRSELVAETRRMNNAMAASLAEVLSADRDRIDAEITEALALEDAWRARIAIDMIVAGGSP